MYNFVIVDFATIEYFCFFLSFAYITEKLCVSGIPFVLSSPVNDPAAIASSIKYHAQFTPSFSPEGFGLPKAYVATAESVRDALIINWNATNDYYEKTNVKQAYYLSMEFLQVT